MVLDFVGGVSHTSPIQECPLLQKSNLEAMCRTRLPSTKGQRRRRHLTILHPCPAQRQGSSTPTWLYGETSAPAPSPRSLLSVVSNASIAQKCWASPSFIGKESRGILDTASQGTTKRSLGICKDLLAHGPTSFRWQHHHRRR